jgi:tetratricopeptide (TPR) repeat protein
MEIKDADYWFNEGEKFFRSQKFKEAEECYRKAKNHSDAAYKLGIILYISTWIKRKKSLLLEACEMFKEATRLKPDNANAFSYWGNTLSTLARYEQDEALFSESFNKFYTATQLDPNNFYAFHLWGVAISSLAIRKQDEILFKESFEKFNKAIQLKPNNTFILVDLGSLLCILAEFKQDKLWFLKEVDEFERASKQINDSDIFFIKWRLYNILNQEDNAIENLKKSGKSILSVLSSLISMNNVQEIQISTLYPLLDSDIDDGIFFREATQAITDKYELNKYKEIYIISICIISQLQARGEYGEDFVAHYLKKNISQEILFNNDSKFRLNAINYSNDPTEGGVLLNYLFGGKKSTVKNSPNLGYRAFAGCFTFNYDSLNQFRLYGKENDKEGTGLSLVFRNNFFSINAEIATKQQDNNSTEKDDKRMFFQFHMGGSETALNLEDIHLTKKESKHALFRCIYVDPIEQRVISVGHKEEYLFYREGNDSVVNYYNTYIQSILTTIRNWMERLKELVKNLSPSIIESLLINLRYLTKHVAFKEEQECRIIRIHRLNDENSEIISDEDYKQMYVDYTPKPSYYIKEIYFGPKATGMELFQDILAHKGLNIQCKRSRNPLA